MNFADSEVVASILKKDGYELTDKAKDANLVLLNTCSIRDKAEQTVRNKLKNFNSQKKENKDLKVGLLGCMAERLKEKLLAAHRAGIKQVLIPKENEKDLVDMPKKIIDDIKIIPVENADEVLKIALTKELKKTEWVEVDMSKKDDKSQASIQ